MRKNFLFFCKNLILNVAYIKNDMTIESDRLIFAKKRDKGISDLTRILVSECILKLLILNTYFLVNKTDEPHGSD
jgi:hypothetical protein